MEKKPNTNLSLVVTAIAVILICFLLSFVIHIDGFFVVFSGILVYIVGISKEILPDILKDFTSREKNDNIGRIQECERRFHRIEERLDDVYQTALKAQASIEASFVDEYLEEERINTKKVFDIEKDLQQIRNELNEIKLIVSLFNSGHITDTPDQASTKME